MANLKEYMLISILLMLCTSHQVWANGPNMEKVSTEQKLAFLMVEFDQLKQEVSALMAENTKEMETMKLENHNLKKEIEQMHSAIQHLTVQRLMFSKTVQDLENKQSKESGITQNNNFMSTDKRNSDNLKQVTNSLRSNHQEPQLYSNEINRNNFVAFMAIPSETRDYNDGDIVLFDWVLRNYGDYYDATDSTFVCPVTGYYLFTVTVLTNGSGKSMSARVYLELQELLLISHADGGSKDQGSSTVVTLCNANDVVTVRCADYDNQLYGDFHSSFTGVLLSIA